MMKRHKRRGLGVSGVTSAAVNRCACATPHAAASTTRVVQHIRAPQRLTQNVYSQITTISIDIISRLLRKTAVK